MIPNRPRRTGVPRQSWVVLVKETTSLARDRETLLHSIIIPLFLYPALVWLGIQIVLYAEGTRERIVSRVLVTGEEADPGLAAFLDERPEIEVVRRPDGPPASGEAAAAAPSRAGGSLDGADAALVLDLPAAAAPVPRVVYRSADEASDLAADRVRAALQDRGRRLWERDVRAAGCEADPLDPLDVEEHDLATRSELTSHIASLLLPLVLIIMTALGAFYPALETTVGERERGTLETTLAAPASRLALVLGKYGAVVAFSLLAFLLNFGSMWFAFHHLRSQFRVEAFRLEPGAAIVILCAAVLLAALLGALMVALGSLARTFREGQSFLTPIYLLVTLPAMLAASPDVRLTAGLGAVPVVNISLLLREALRGQVEAGMTAWTLLASSAHVALAIALAVRLLGRAEPGGRRAGPAVAAAAAGGGGGVDDGGAGTDPGGP